MASASAEPVGKSANGWEQFQADFGLFWRSLPHKWVFGVMLLAWVGLFQFLGNSTYGYIVTDSLFGWMHYVYSSSPDDGHCYYIPVVVLVLMWWKREDLMAVPKKPAWGAVSLVALGLVIHLLGYMVQQNRISIVGFFVGLYGLMGAVWGWRWLEACFFPYFLVVFCVPMGTMADELTVPLRLVVSFIAAGIANMGLGVNVIREGTQLFDPQGLFQYDVAAACSGIRSLTVLLALTTIYGFITFRAWWKRLLMVAIALPLAVLGNVVRITGVIVTAEAFGEEAGMKFHDGAGFVTFVIALVAVMALGAWLREKDEQEVGEIKEKVAAV